MSERWEGSEFNIENVGKAEEIDVFISELARIVGGERPLVGECGDLLSKTYKSQVEECCLRGQQIQLHSFILFILLLVLLNFSYKSVQFCSHLYIFSILF